MVLARLWLLDRIDLDVAGGTTPEAEGPLRSSDSAVHHRTRMNEPHMIVETYFPGATTAAGKARTDPSTPTQCTFRSRRRQVEGEAHRELL